MSACVVFDINTRIDDVKAKLKEMGYYSSWLSNGIAYDLPNSMMWSPNATLDTALQDV